MSNEATVSFTALIGQVRTLENTSWSCGTDEYKDGVSDSAVNKRADLARQARTKVDESLRNLCNERDALLAEVEELHRVLALALSRAQVDRMHELQRQGFTGTIYEAREKRFMPEEYKPALELLDRAALSGKVGEGNG